MQKPTKEQKKRIREVMNRPIVYDDNAPELTEEQYKAFAVVAEEQRKARKKSWFPYGCPMKHWRRLKYWDVATLEY